MPEDGTGTQTGTRTHQEWSADQLVCIRGCRDLEIELSTKSESISCVRKKIPFELSSACDGRGRGNYSRSDGAWPQPGVQGFGSSFPFDAFQVEVESLFLLDTGEKMETQTGSNSRPNLGWESGFFGMRRCSQNTAHPFSKAIQ